MRFLRVAWVAVCCLCFTACSERPYLGVDGVLAFCSESQPCAAGLDCVEGLCRISGEGDAASELEEQEVAPEASVWTDPETGLTWQDPPLLGALRWSEAVEYCDGLNTDGGGWRLPAISELRTLIRYCKDTEVGGSCEADEEDCPWARCGCIGCYDDVQEDDPDVPDSGCYRVDALQGKCGWTWSSPPKAPGLT